ncbi:hypothetical protein PK28_17940 (plasmid) [Hymenobacter sp. DG25B]|nr:hypothetical protein PK28_17940 [Hymenobacter sp. DG25B]
MAVDCTSPFNELWEKAITLLNRAFHKRYKPTSGGITPVERPFNNEYRRRLRPHVPKNDIFGQNLTSICMSTKTLKSETTPAAAKQTEITRETIHRRVKQAQERRRNKLKHVNP